MRLANVSYYLLLCLSVACTTTPVPRAGPLPLPPSTPTPTPTRGVSGPWSFNYAAGPTSYQISRSAAIESQSDSGTHREISTNATHELLRLDAVGDTIRFSALIDTFSTTTQGVIGPVQPVRLPTQLSGTLIGDSLIFADDSLSEKCNPASSALIADLRNFLVHFPGQLQQGNSWRDSVQLQSCQAMIPATAQIIRTYVVLGETDYQGEAMLTIQRIDTIRAHGEGAQQQHRLTFDATGTGTALYHLRPTDGHVAHLVTGQDLTFEITTSGTTHHFKQSSKQEFSLLR
jgi:hypothetical protein